MFLGTFDEKIFHFRCGRPPPPTSPMATLAVLVITTTAATQTLTMKRDLGNLSDFLIQEFVEPMSRCYTTNPYKRWEYCDVPLCGSGSFQHLPIYIEGRTVEYFFSLFSLDNKIMKSRLLCSNKSFPEPTADPIAPGYVSNVK